MKGSGRIRRLQKLMVEQEIDLVVLWPSANWRYLVSYAPIAVERPTFLFVSPEKTCAVGVLRPSHRPRLRA